MEEPDVKILLEAAADSSSPQGLHIYGLNDTQTGYTISYSELRAVARNKALQLRSLAGFKPHSVFLLHFNQHYDNILWFWAVVYAGCVPCISTPFANNVEARKAHIHHLGTLLEHPLCITRKELLARDFADTDTSTLRVTCVEELDSADSAASTHPVNLTPVALRDDGLSVLMLTSGSTGNAKAVCLTHHNLLAAVQGKERALPTPAATAYFNFIGLDHVVGLIEAHLLALYNKASQVHVQAADLFADPLVFIRLADKHRVSRVFAPNFFLAKLRQAIESRLADNHVNLSCLTRIASGGEANVVETADALSRLLMKFGAPRNCIVPAWGMTETCAGVTFNTDCPDHDVRMKYEFAAVGECCPGIQSRIRPLKAASTTDASIRNGGVRTASDTSGDYEKPSRHLGTEENPATVGQTHVQDAPTGLTHSSSHVEVGEDNGIIGDLEVAGDIVFGRYFNNAASTEESFTRDGWFKTGDLARIDATNKINIVGRTKETMTINGIKYLPHEIEFAIEDAGVPGLTSSFTACFAHRYRGAPTEHVCVVYLPSFEASDIQGRIRALEGITKVVVLLTGSKPVVLPLDTASLQKSTLGKLSRSKIKIALEQGKYAHHEKFNENIVTTYRLSRYTPPATEAETTMSSIFNDALGLSEGELGVDAPYFEAGLTSIELLQVRRRIELAFGLSEEIPMITMITGSDIRSLAKAIERLASSGTVRPYDPVVTLNRGGHKTPLFLFHPGVGEILVFLGLAQHLDDRPVYALRARGFNKGEAFFESIAEVIRAYYTAIRGTQEHGPYALAGYSWGSMLAFEVAKRLESDGEEVGFLGALNLPPHIKWRMRQFDWVECVAHLAYFSDLISEESTAQIAPHLRTLPSKEAQLAYLIGVANPQRLSELALTPASLSNWADVAFSLQSRAVDYEPSGWTKRMDVFYCRPLAILGITKQQWKDQHLSAWENFVGDVNYHEVEGAHYTMLLPEHVGSFQFRLKRVLKMRGV